MSTKTVKIENLVVGRKYLIHYQSDNQRYMRQAVMVYLGREEGTLIWDLRPKAGTQRMPGYWVSEMYDVPSDTSVYFDRRALSYETVHNPKSR
jgi:hypothetical protein